LKDGVTKHRTTPKRTGWMLCSIGLVALLCECPLAAAGPLELDPTFNGTGKVVTNFQLDSQFAQDIGRDIAVLQDGTIIAVGAAYAGEQKQDDFALVRYLANGSTAQGSMVHTDFNSTVDEAYAVVIQPDGKIVVAGFVQDQSGDSKSVDFALARYDPDLTLDESFGNNGLVRTDFGAFEAAYDVALQPDDKIVVVGQREPNGNDSDFLIARYMPNGALDTTFGDAGKVITDFGAWDRGLAVEVQNDEKIVVVGSSWGPNFQQTRGALARYTSTGELDASFDGGLGLMCLLVQACGKTKVDLAGGYPVALALRKADGSEDGKIVVAGKFGAARFNANGTLDEYFGGAGIVESQDNLADAVAIEASGDIVIAGTDYDDFAVAIYKPNGKRCSATTTDFKGNIDEALATAIQPDGAILVLGHASIGPEGDFALARYLGGNCPVRISKNFLAYHVYVPPYELIGPPIPMDGLFKQLQIGSSEQLAFPAADGRSFSESPGPGYQAFKLTRAEKDQLNGTIASVTNSFGDAWLEVLEPQQLLVPTDIAAAEAAGITASDLRSEPLMKCYGAKMHGNELERKPVTITDGLNRTWTIETGEPAVLCKPIDEQGGNAKGRVIGLVGYPVTGARGPDVSPESVSLPIANEFGAHMVQVGQPELLFLLSLVE
jgi:uncharacterized delta-60 repeat protein